MPQTRKGPGVGSRASSELIAASTTSVADLLELPHARAYAAPPCRGRSLWLVVVLTCPHCGTSHSHRVGEVGRLLSNRITKCCPVTGLWYRLGPVQRRKQARSRA
ncbi:hypothetical protein GCM10010169_23340 [Micromonospora fulviviridis]|nr:hypothetical protein GCM10010169_23340 [Micromonospora fulviviridis]